MLLLLLLPFYVAQYHSTFITIGTCDNATYSLRDDFAYNMK